MPGPGAVGGERDVALKGESGRLTALDALRGLAVAGMILVNSPGDWRISWPQLHHADWHGWTLADFVFPGFLFSAGMALGLSFPRTVDGALWHKVLKRVALLMLIGLALNLLPDLNLATLRIPGILQRIALCYLLGLAIGVATGRRDAAGRVTFSPEWLGVAAAGLLLLYWVLLATVGGGQLDPAGNLGARIDRAVFTVSHLWLYGTDASGAVVYDPEGLLSTIPATANLLAGMIAGIAWRRRGEGAWPWLLGAGVALLVLGLALDPWVPINKRIWTPSFALLSIGVALAVLVLLGALLRARPGRWVAAPLMVLGGNAILAFILSQLLGVAGGIGWLPGGQSPQGWGFGVAKSIIADPYLASFACAVAVLALVVLILVPLQRRGIHLRL
ncbi:MAG: DUF1624 domain-containing protein [Sphingomonas sp.]|nr:DUF1624 domain-containing protein [Sphingomonas sp.]